LLVDQSFAKVYASPGTGFIGLVDAAQGLHRFYEEKCVTVCFTTEEVEAWFERFVNLGVELHTPSIQVECEAVQLFVAYDAGGYYLEFDRFLEHEKNQGILEALKK
jgi:hypothetical protein